jgi:hypothetical protein
MQRRSADQSHSRSMKEAKCTRHTRAELNKRFWEGKEMPSRSKRSALRWILCDFVRARFWGIESS